MLSMGDLESYESSKGYEQMRAPVYKDGELVAVIKGIPKAELLKELAVFFDEEGKPAVSVYEGMPGMMWGVANPSGSVGKVGYRFTSHEAALNAMESGLLVALWENQAETAKASAKKAQAIVSPVEEEVPEDAEEMQFGASEL